MANTNAFLAMRAATYTAMRDEWVKHLDEGQSANAAHAMLFEAMNFGTHEGKWRAGPGAVVVETYVDDVALVLRAARAIDAQIICIGAWQANGLEHGQSFDEAGNVVGTPTYARNDALLLEAMPDLVTVDENGNELTRDRPTELYQNARLAGWEPRRYG